MKAKLITLASVGLLVACVGARPAARVSCPPAPSTVEVPEHGDAIPNISVVEEQIRKYYGDTVAADGQHFPSETGPYARELAAIETEAKGYLLDLRSKSKARLTIVLDVDDTSLNTYNYEIAYHFVYDRTANGDYVTHEKFPAVFGMPELATWAASQGYAVFFVTGRPEAQRDATARNLTKVGFATPAPTHLFFRNKDNPPPYLKHCEPCCTTVQYKSETRAYIESLGYEIAADFGDQNSDLEGGHSGRTFKLPNPMYFLP